MKILGKKSFNILKHTFVSHRGSTKQNIMGATSEHSIKEKKKSSCAVDGKFLPFKIHYFLLCGAHVGVIPYLPVFAKTSLGLSATTVGVLTTCMQFSTTISKPVVGIVADCYNKVKAILVALICLEVVLNLSMLALPRFTADIPTIVIDSNNDTSRTLLRMVPARIYDASASSYFQIKSTWEAKKDVNYLPLETNEKMRYINEFKNNSLLKNSLTDEEFHPENQITFVKGNNKHIKNSSKHTHCHLHCLHTRIVATCRFNQPVCMDSNTENSMKCSLQKWINYYKFCGNILEAKKFVMTFNIANTSMKRVKNEELNLVPRRISYFQKNLNRMADISCANTYTTCSLHCEKDIQLCPPQLEKVYFDSSLQFWIYAVCAILSAMCQGSIFTLSDTVCFATLKGTGAEFGKQRFWGAIGWGSVAFLAGYLNDLASEVHERSDYSPGFYTMTTLSMVFILNVLLMKFEHQPRNFQTFKSLKKTFRSKEFLMMEVCVFLSGFLTAFSAFFLMWHLESLGGSRLLMGLALAVECLLGEAPFMFFSGAIIDRIGHRNVLTLAFLAFSARFTGYYLLQNPWLVLPIELLNGLTYGLFYPTMASYAKLISPPGAEGTVQGVFGGTFQGLGTGVGSLVAGLAFDKFGGRKSFLMAAVISAFAAVFNCIMCLFSRKSKQKQESTESV